MLMNGLREKIGGGKGRYGPEVVEGRREGLVKEKEELKEEVKELELEFEALETEVQMGS